MQLFKLNVKYNKDMLLSMIYHNNYKYLKYWIMLKYNKIFTTKYIYFKSLTKYFLSFKQIKLKNHKNTISEVFLYNVLI